jgi:hypothetical protein
MRWDGEDTLDLADIGGETGTPAHGASVASPGRMPKQVDMANGPWDRSEIERGTPICRHPTRYDRGRRTAFTRLHPDRREPPSGAIAAVARCGDPARYAGRLVGAGGCRQSHAVPEEKAPAGAALSPSVLCEQGLGFAILVVVSVLGTWPPAIHASGHRSGGADLAIPHHPVDR